MKVRHMATAIRHDAGFILRNGGRMLAHTFRGTTWRSAVGLESARDAFGRYRAIRQRERNSLDWPDPLDRHVGQGSLPAGRSSLPVGRGFSPGETVGLAPLDPALNSASTGELSTPTLRL